MEIQNILKNSNQFKKIPRLVVNKTLTISKSTYPHPIVNVFRHFQLGGGFEIF